MDWSTVLSLLAFIASVGALAWWLKNKKGDKE